MASNRSSRRTLVTAGLIVAALAGAGWFWIESSLSRKWAALNQRVDSLQADWDRTLARPVLRGTPLPGNAWDDYGEALRRAPTVTAEDLKILRKIKASDREEVLSLVRGQDAAVEALRRGVRHDRVAPPDRVTVDDFTPLFVLGRAQAQVLTHDGKPLEAVQLLLDLAQCAQDLDYKADAMGRWDSVWLLDLALSAVPVLLDSRSLTSEDAAQIARELETLEQNAPRRSVALLKTLLQWGTWCRAQDLSFAGSRPASLPSLRSWRHLYSARLLLADSFGEVDHWYFELAKRADQSWAEEQKTSDKIAEEVLASTNLLIGPHSSKASVASNLLPGCDADPVSRALRTQLRLLRMLAQFRATGETQDLGDPFGEKMFHACAGPKIKVWSVGPDGTNHGGQGGWEALDKIGLWKGKDALLEGQRY